MLRHIVMPWRHSVMHDINHICKYRINDILELVNPKYYRNKKITISLARLRAEIDYRLFLTSWHDVMTSRHHANTKPTTFSNSVTQSFIETKKIIIFLAHLQAEIGKKVCVRHAVTSWRHVMAWRHHASTYTIIAWNPAIEIIAEIHMYHHVRTSTSWYRRSEFCDIMTSRHDVMTSCKHKNDNIFELGKPENYRNKKRIISLALLQAEIEYRLFLTSWHDVMTWRHYANTKLTTFLNSATQSFIETKKESSF